MSGPDTQSLIWKALDGMASADEVDALRQQLAEDPAATEAFAAAVAHDSLLRELSTEKCSASTRLEEARLTHRGRLDGTGRTTWRRAAPWLVAAALLLTVGAFLLLRGRGTDDDWRATVASLQGEATVLREGIVLKATAEARLRTGDVIETVAEARVTLQYRGEATLLELGPLTRLALRDERGATLLNLDRGRLDAQVAPRAPDRTVVVVTPDARVVSEGARFTIVAETGRTRLEVAHGRVKLARPDGSEEVVVPPGSAAVSGPDAAPAIVPVAVAEPVEDTVLLHFDFEDGQISDEWIGMIAVGPAREGNSFCLQGRNTPEHDRTRVILSDDERCLFTYRKGAVLTFDCWLDDSVAYLNVFVWDRTRGISAGHPPVHSPPKEQWTRVALPLADFIARRRRRLRDGDLVKDITIQTGAPDEKLYVDNVEVILPGPGPGER